MTTIKGPGIRPPTMPEVTVQTTKEVAKVATVTPQDRLTNESQPTLTEGASQTIVQGPQERALAMRQITSLKDLPQFEGDGPGVKPGLPLEVPANVDLKDAQLSHDDTKALLQDRDNPAIKGDYRRALEQLLKEIDLDDLSRGGR